MGWNTGGNSEVGFGNYYTPDPSGGAGSWNSGGESGAAYYSYDNPQSFGDYSNLSPNDPYFQLKQYKQSDVTGGYGGNLPGSMRNWMSGGQQVVPYGNGTYASVADIQAALAKDPNNALLQGLHSDAWGKQVAQPSGDFGFEQFLLPTMMGAIGLGAAGLGPLAGAGTDAAALGDSYGVAAGGTEAAAGTGSAPLWQQPTAGGVPDTGFGTSVSAPGADPLAAPTPQGGAVDSIMNNPYAGGGGVGIPAPAPELSAYMGGSVLPSSGVGFGTGSLMGDAAAGGAAAGAAEGGDIWSTINGLLGPTPINGVTGAGILGAGVNALVQGNASSQYGDLANQVRQSGSALNDPQRAPYQGQLSTMMQNPSQYLNSDPFATALTAHYRNNVIPRNIAQSGNAANVIDSQGSQFVGALSQDYGQKIGQLSGLGGFGFPPSGYTPSAVGAAGSGAIGAQASAVGGLGTVLGQNFAQPAAGTAGTKGIFGTGVA